MIQAIRPAIREEVVNALQARVEGLRALLKTYELEAYIIPSADEHLNEYLPESKKRREWISGFTGSAGDALVGRDRAIVFVDSRYFEQADFEIPPAIFQISKLGQEGHPTLLESLKSFARPEHAVKIGVDPLTMTVDQFYAFEKELNKVNISLLAVQGNLLDQVRKSQPQEQGAENLERLEEKAEVFMMPEGSTGASIETKLQQVRQAMTNVNTDVLPITKLDQTAWLFNLRGQDIPYNPVFEAYAIITPDEAALFIDQASGRKARIRAADKPVLEKQVNLYPYEDYLPMLKRLIETEKGAQILPKKILIDPKQTTYGTVDFLKSQGFGERIVESTHPVLTLKARKNPREIDGMKQANLLASRAKIRALHWLAREIKTKQLTELDFKEAMEAFYAEEPEFFGLSFNTIAAAGSHSSIVHYGTPSDQQQIQLGQFFLIDSGAQYYCPEWAGTTDDTRAVWVGENSGPEEKQLYTDVLKAHIQCAMQHFPKGTNGALLDGITRANLWNAGLDFGHGTGHGVGAFLNVHEGPNGIHRLATEPLIPGMITSIEPGFYLPGWGGIRLENLYLVVDTGQRTRPDEKPLYRFEPLTYIPFDKQLIDLARLTIDQQAWLERYYETMLEKLPPLLSSEEAAWLEEQCRL